ncbi:MAG: DUF494 family protein [FCB group bacterium]|jgi:uncharacterized protein Smg (DUF494 family)
MYEKIIEIIVFVIAELKQNKHFDEIDIDELQRLGYTKEEISTAFSWLVDRIEFSDKFPTTAVFTNVKSFRVLHDVEKQLFTPEAWGDLIQLHSLGIITNEMIEVLIERAIMMGMQEIDCENLKSFVASFIFNAHSNNSMSQRYMLKGNETVN